MILIQAILLLFVFNERKEIKIFEAFVIQGSIPLSSEPQTKDINFLQFDSFHV